VPVFGIEPRKDQQKAVQKGQIGGKPAAGKEKVVLEKSGSSDILVAQFWG
jgi:hypothetical protein